MQVTILAFAQAHDQLGFSERIVECSSEETPRSILARLSPHIVPENIRIAVDHEYASWDQPIGEAKEIALIPPVSGG